MKKQSDFEQSDAAAGEERSSSSQRRQPQPQRMPQPPQHQQQYQPQQQRHLHDLHYRQDAAAMPILRGVWGTMHHQAKSNSSSSDAAAAIEQQQQLQRGASQSSSSKASASTSLSASASRETGGGGTTGDAIGGAPTHFLNPQRLHDRFAMKSATATDTQQLQSPILLPPAKWHHARTSMPTAASTSTATTKSRRLYDNQDEEEDEGREEDAEDNNAQLEDTKSTKYELQDHRHSRPRHHQHHHLRPSSSSSLSSSTQSSSSVGSLPAHLSRPPLSRDLTSSSSLTPPAASLSLANRHGRGGSALTPGEPKVSSVRSATSRSSPDNSSLNSSMTPSDKQDVSSSQMSLPAVAAGQPDAAGTATVAGKKRTRYLRDTDRRNIIQRIENGEKQAALAREFGVTRAAICHIKKNREEIITRYDLLVQSAKDLDSSVRVGSQQPADESVTVLEARSHAVLILLTTLRNTSTSPAEFRRAACRLIMILLEEAIASLGSKTVEVTTPSGHTYLGRQQVGQLCGVAVGEEGYPFRKFFNQMEPDAARGYIHMDLRASAPQSRHWRIEQTDLPPNVSECKVLLFSATSSDGECVCKAIEVLRGLRVPETRICVVTILSAAEAVQTLTTAYPEVKIITAAVDADVDSRMGEILPGLGDFMVRYNSD